MKQMTIKRALFELALLAPAIVAGGAFILAYGAITLAIETL